MQQQQNGRPYSQQRFAHPEKSRKKAIDLRTHENYRVNYLCYLYVKGESCKEEKLQKSRKETPFMESKRIAAGKQQGRDYSKSRVKYLWFVQP